MLTYSEAKEVFTEMFKVVHASDNKILALQEFASKYPDFELEYRMTKKLNEPQLRATEKKTKLAYVVTLKDAEQREIDYAEKR